MNWLREALTDNHGEFDVVQIVLPIAVLGMLGLSAWSVVVNKQPFDGNQLGVGIGAVISALGVYKWGDSKTPRP